MTAADRAPFRALRLKALERDPDAFLMTAEEERRAERLDLEAAIESPGSIGWIYGAFADARLIGAVALIVGGPRKIAHLGRIVSLVVDPDRRRGGIGRALMTHAIAAARARGLHALRLDVVAENGPAIALHRGLGFVDYGRELAGYRDGTRAFDLLLMSLSLTA